MNLLNDRRIPLVLVLLLFIIPLNIYVIGEWIGTGVQWALFRYQETSYGTSLITLTRDLEFITSGTITGKTAISISFWIAGVVLLIIAFITLAAMIAEEMKGKIHILGLFVIASGILLLLSCMTQYGLHFSGPAGFCIPVGIPFTLVLGWLIYSRTWQGNEKEASDELNSDTD